MEIIYFILFSLCFTRHYRFKQGAPKFWCYMAFYFVFGLDGDCVDYSFDMGFEL